MSVSPMRRPLLALAATAVLSVGGAMALGAGKAKPPASARTSNDPPPEPVPAAILADPLFCGLDLEEPADRPLPCQIPALPCGPVPAAGIGASGIDTNEDLDGDGQPDGVLAGIRVGPGAYAYGVIYRYTPVGMVLSDFQRVELPADPAVAVVVQSMPRGAPLLRDGQDLPLRDGRTLSVGRIRRWDGQRFRTLITFCADRQEPQADRAPRTGHNRVTFPDVDGDGTPELVISGAVPPTVFRIANSKLREDPELTRRYRVNSPEERKARMLRSEAEQLYGRGLWRRAAEVLKEARDLTPRNGELLERYAAVLTRLGEDAAALEQLRQAVAVQPERASAQCALAEALRKADDDDELAVLRQCLARGPEASRRADVQQRLRALEEEERASLAPRDGGVRD